MSTHEPRFFRVAALVAGPTRARMLAVHLGGEYRSAGELATAAGITPQAASTQLAVQFDTLLQALDVHASRHFNALRVHPAVIR